MIKKWLQKIIFDINKYVKDKEGAFFEVATKATQGEGKLTIGFGRYGAEEGQTTTKKEAEQMLLEDIESRNTRDFQFTLEQSTAQNEEINIQHARSNFGLLLEETSGDNIIGEDDETSIGTSILLENSADTGDDSYLLTEDYIVGDYVQDKTAQNELFDSLDDNVLDFSESNPFGDAGVFA